MNHELEIKCSKCGVVLKIHTEADVSDPETRAMVERMMRFVKCDRCAFGIVEPKPTIEEYEQKLPYKDL